MESRLRAVHGNGGHDVRLGYLWMLAGTDEQVKPDRKVLHWLSRYLGHQVDVPAARRLLADAPPSWTGRPGSSTTRSWKAAWPEVSAW
ncbi:MULTISPECIES: hypothetical protein [unclassified Amycolatopsis]|uniref:hypothetical protein n=1 Tax=unclassified Amycolatopsis TaxID=2618356 RepID=UPI00287582B6|nr:MULTISPECIES: hypothetical protein [unclassified Amycolatopsis]MDS0132747.1 hypothetical protein [Amycolatopsis sp. 505]MDS0142428.1 hypothetical protein [Amycolatopsis sp. CM201R]